MPDGRHNLLSSATFISCIFTNLIAFGYSGGAIYFADQSEGTLTVTNCFFEHCEVSISQGNGNGGGAIYAGSVSKVNIVCSSFIRCRCNNTNRSDGGAIGLYNILTHPRVTACTLLFCMAEDDGGAMSLWSSSGDANQLFCDQSFFLQNTASGSTDPGGGCIILYHSTALPCSNCLFCDSTAFYGGALYLNCSIYLDNNYTVRFCFFCRNSAAQANDIYFYSALSDSPLIHCFSTSSSTRLSNGKDID